VTEPLVPREDARASLEAHRELGPAYEEELAERFAQRIEARLRGRAPARPNADHMTAVTVVSIIAAIPMLGIAGATAGAAGIALVCVALVLINYFARR
jgi:uncharacterized membrane protein YtjA (UPF0391 family)